MPSFPELPALAFLAGVVLISLSGVMMPGPVTAVTLAKGRYSPVAGAWIAVGHGLVEFPLMIAIAAGFEAVFADDAVAFYIGLIGGAMLLFMGATMLRNARVMPTDLLAVKDSHSQARGGGKGSSEDIAKGGSISPVSGGGKGSVKDHPAGGSSSNVGGGEEEEESFEDSAKIANSARSTEPMDLPMGPVAAGVVTTLSNPYFFLWWASVGLLLISEAAAFGLVVLGAMMVAHWLCDLGWDWFVSGVTFRSRSIWTPTVHRGVFSVCGLILVLFGLWFGVGAALAGP